MFCSSRNLNVNLLYVRKGELGKVFRFDKRAVRDAVKVLDAQNGDTPLHVVEDVESCRMLLAAGADASVRNGDGLSPAGNARGEGRDAIADLLTQAHPAAAAADDASVIAARREAAADGDEAMEKLELSLNQLSEAAGGVPAEENSNKRARV